MPRKELHVAKDYGNEMERHCIEAIGACTEVLFDEEVVFDDGNRMVIQVIKSNDYEPAWSQGVLLDKDGFELGSTVGESFEGEYCIGDYVVDVIITPT